MVLFENRFQKECTHGLKMTQCHVLHQLASYGVVDMHRTVLYYMA